MIRHTRTSRVAAFTLVEILIIVVILGIIAAIIVPQFASAGDDAKEASLLVTINILREQIDFYRFEHNGNGPHVGPLSLGLGGLEITRRLTERTDVTGEIDPNGPYGPYLNVWPGNPFSDESVAKLIQAGYGVKPPRTGVTGWYYDVNTCIISANSVTGGESSDPP